LRRLHRHLIGDAIRGIEPEIGGGLETATQRDENALRDITGIHADLGDSGAVDVHPDRRQIHQLLHVHVSGAGHLAEAVGNLIRERMAGLDIGADDLNVDGSGQTEIQNLSNDVGGLKEKLHSGETPRQLLTQLPNVVAVGA